MSPVRSMGRSRRASRTIDPRRCGTFPDLAPFPSRVTGSRVLVSKGSVEGKARHRVRGEWQDSTPLSIFTRGLIRRRDEPVSPVGVAVASGTCPLCPSWVRPGNSPWTGICAIIDPALRKAGIGKADANPDLSAAMAIAVRWAPSLVSPVPEAIRGWAVTFPVCLTRRTKSCTLADHHITDQTQYTREPHNDHANDAMFRTRTQPDQTLDKLAPCPCSLWAGQRESIEVG